MAEESIIFQMKGAKNQALVYGFCKIGLLFILAVLLSSAVYSFDGRRHGVIISLGGGFSPVAEWSLNEGTSNNKSNAGYAIDITVGYCIAQHDVVAFYKNFTASREDIMGTSMQEYTGVLWERYFGKEGKAYGFRIGIGFSALASPGFTRDPGFGYTGGLIYEFARHWHVILNYSKGKDVHGAYRFSNVNLLIAVQAY